MSVIEKDIRPTLHNFIGGILGAGAIAIIASETVRNFVLSFLTAEIPVWQVLIALVLVSIPILWQIKKVRGLRQIIRDQDEQIAQFVDKNAKSKQIKANQHSRQIKQINRSGSKWLGGWLD